jgi:Cyclin, N-terminal domain
MPQETVLSMRDLFEEYGEANSRAFDAEKSDAKNQSDAQMFDMSPAFVTAATTHTSRGDRGGDCGMHDEYSGRNRPTRPSYPPPLTTASPVSHAHRNRYGSTLPSYAISNDDSPPTPVAISPSSFTNEKVAKQMLPVGKPSAGGPVLYSAIGSLEDPMTASSFSRRYNERKFEFPSLLAMNKSSTAAKKSSPKTAVDVKDGSNRGASRSGDRGAKPKKSPPTAAKDSSEVAHAVETENPSKELKKTSNLRSHNDDSATTLEAGATTRKSVTIADAPRPSSRQKVRKKSSPTEMFRPSSDAYTPRMGKKVIKYKDPEMRTPVASMASPLGTLQRPNFRDALRRVAMILHQHVVKIEHRFENQTRQDDGLFRASMREVFSEEAFATPTYRCTMVRVPMARPGMVYGLKRLRPKYTIPSEAEIYDFAHRLFKAVQLSSECSIVCLIYVERLMETAKVPLLSDTWRPIFMCGLLLASKVWQDLSSWNIEFACVYPQYSLESINRLELLFLRNVKWDLYISSSSYAKYYFALRSLVEKQDFRQRYNRMVGGVNSVQASEALKIEKRSYMVKEEALSQLSRSM